MKIFLGKYCKSVHYFVCFYAFFEKNFELKTDVFNLKT